MQNTEAGNSSFISLVKGRPRVRAGRSVDIRDWEKQSEVLSNWNNELCSGDSLPEVEIISLLEEQIPRYKLRADTRTKFGGYENQDWFIPSPALQIDEADLKLSPDQIRETLNYFLLCSNRVSQMTKTYDDIEAVTRLLEEKEKDLELTARIGKELLQTNSKLENTVASLETDLRAALEKITQLSHEVHKKTELIQILTNDMDESLFETGSSGRINLDLLQKKMANLEEENKALKSEYCRLAKDTETVEEQEQMLLKDLTGQLTCANSSVGYLADELDRQKDENRIQHEQLLTLQAKLEDMEEKLRKFMHENEELNGLLQITKDNQGSLAIELAEFKARYYEVESLLRETQEQLRKMRKKQVPGARISLFSSLGGATTTTNLSSSSGAAAPHNLAPFDSLQSELEMSMHSEFSTDSGISNPDVVPQYKKVFETVRCASQSSLSSAESTGSSSHRHSSAAAYIGGAPSGTGYMTTSTSVMSSGSSAGQGPRMSIRAQTSDFRRSSGSVYSSSSLGYPSIDSTGHSDTEFSLTDSDDGGGYPSQNQKGIPGAPGASELEAALKRLTPGEVLARRANLQHGPAYGGYEGETYAPFGCRTPDSLMSTGSGNYMGWKLPEKLQIVKPIEGSQTLHQWSQLAQPTFGGLLDERPGVKIRGGKELEEMGLESYALSDLEEDEEYSNPGKVFDSLIPTYTLTNSTVMHPDDGTFVTSSNVGSRMASVCSSIQNSPPQTPQGTLSRRNSCTTFSTTYGLAKILNERGIKAATPSAFNTPCGTNSFTPTATPCNSPDGGMSASSSRSNSPDRDYRFSIPQLIFGSVMPQFFKDSMGAGGGGGGSDGGGTSTGAKKKTTATPSGGRNSRRDGSLNSSGSGSSRSSSKDESRTSESLVGKIERIGITNLMGSAPGALSISTGGLYARPALTSPMAQLTCLLPSHSNENLTHIGSTGTSTTKSPSSNMKTPAASAQSGMGIPGRPGSGALSKRLEQLNSRKQRRQGVTRPDLGTVSTKKSLPPSTMAEQPPEQQTSTLGTISSLLFGRKGGLF